VNFGLPIAASTLWTAAGIFASLAIGAYILKMRRRRFEVPFSSLWHRVIRDNQTTSLWRRLKRLLSLLLQLLILASLLVAAADPIIGAPPEHAKHVVIVIDASASMKAIDSDGKRARIDIARERAHDLVAALGSGDAAMLLRMDGRSTPLTRFETDKAALHRAVDSVAADDTPADLRRALSAAADALRDRQNPVIVIIGDGAYPKHVLEAASWAARAAPASPAERQLAAIDLAGIEVAFVAVGQRGDNLGIVAFNVRRYLTNKLSYEVFVEVQNFASTATGVELTLYSGDTAVDIQTLQLGAGERVRRTFPNLGGGDSHQLRAVARPVATATVGAIDDVFAVDDQAFALLPLQRSMRVLLVSDDNLYLEGALLVYDNVQVDKLSPDDYDRDQNLDLSPYDAVIFDRHTPERRPAIGNLLYFGPTGPNSPFRITQSLNAPRITDVQANHPVMKWVEMSDVNFDRASVFQIDRAAGEIALASSLRAPIIAARKSRDGKVLAIGFDLRATDLVMRVAFPLLLVNVLEWFAGDNSDLITTYATGHRFRVPVDAGPNVREVQVELPGGSSQPAPISDGMATFYGSTVGIHRVTARDDREVTTRVELAANLANPAESNVQPVRELVLGGKPLTEPQGFVMTRRRSIWTYLVFAALSLVVVEWFTFSRRITV
jgi:Ca-activated chloride channel homolog